MDVLFLLGMFLALVDACTRNGEPFFRRVNIKIYTLNPNSTTKIHTASIQHGVYVGPNGEALILVGTRLKYGQPLIFSAVPISNELPLNGSLSLGGDSKEKAEIFFISDNLGPMVSTMSSQHMLCSGLLTEADSTEVIACAEFTNRYEQISKKSSVSSLTTKLPISTNFKDINDPVVRNFVSSRNAGMKPCKRSAC